MTTPLVHVLILNWNGLEHLEVCLDSLGKSDYPNIKFVLIDNASTDNSLAFAESRHGHDPRFDVMALDENLGWGGGNNAGMRAAMEAGAGYVFLINNDTAVAPDTISKLVRLAGEHPDAGALAPKMLMFHQPDILNSLGMVGSRTGSCWDRGIGRIDGPAWGEVVETLAACGGAAFFRVSALEKVGLLDASFGIYFDDVDMCMRLWMAGYKTLTCPSAIVRHKFSASFQSEAGRRRKYYLGTRNRFRIILKNFPLQEWKEWVPQVLLGECRAIGRALLDGEFWQVGAHARAWISTLRFVPAARRARREQHPDQDGSDSFWGLIVPAPAFCPALVLPEKGWYPEVAGKHPISRHAWRTVDSGRLRISLTNCYAANGPLAVKVTLNGAPLVLLDTQTTPVFEGEVSAGQMDFEAQVILPMEVTGLPHDCGGWVGIEALPTR